MEYVANLSGGKDSLAMVLRLMEEGKPLTKVVNFDEGMNFKSVTNNISRVEPLVESYGAELVRLKPPESFLSMMLVRPIKRRDGSTSYGYGWCGAKARWMTAYKMQVMDRYVSSIGEFVRYIGIAMDESDRAKDKHAVYPLIEWGMSESDCLEYCRSKGFWWHEDGVDVYDVVDRASCWCCRNKNIRELRAIRRYLPEYWNRLKGLQSRIDMPFRRDGLSIFDLDKRFEEEEKQMELFDKIESR